MATEDISRALQQLLNDFKKSLLEEFDRAFEEESIKKDLNFVEKDVEKIRNDFVENINKEIHDIIGNSKQLSDDVVKSHLDSSREKYIEYIETVIDAFKIQLEEQKNRFDEITKDQVDILKTDLSELLSTIDEETINLSNNIKSSSIKIIESYDKKDDRSKIGEQLTTQITQKSQLELISSNIDTLRKDIFELDEKVENFVNRPKSLIPKTLIDMKSVVLDDDYQEQEQIAEEGEHLRDIAEDVGVEANYSEKDAEKERGRLSNLLSGLTGGLKDIFGEKGGLIGSIVSGVFSVVTATLGLVTIVLDKLSAESFPSEIEKIIDDNEELKKAQEANNEIEEKEKQLKMEFDNLQKEVELNLKEVDDQYKKTEEQKQEDTSDDSDQFVEKDEPEYTTQLIESEIGEVGASEHDEDDIDPITPPLDQEQIKDDVELAENQIKSEEDFSPIDEVMISQLEDEIDVIQQPDTDFTLVDPKDVGEKLKSEIDKCIDKKITTYDETLSKNLKEKLPKEEDVEKLKTSIDEQKKSSSKYSVDVQNTVDGLKAHQSTTFDAPPHYEHSIESTSHKQTIVNTTIVKEDPTTIGDDIVLTGKQNKKDIEMVSGIVIANNETFNYMMRDDKSKMMIVMDDIINYKRLLEEAGKKQNVKIFNNNNTIDVAEINTALDSVGDALTEVSKGIVKRNDEDDRIIHHV